MLFAWLDPFQLSGECWSVVPIALALCLLAGVTKQAWSVWLIALPFAWVVLDTFSLRLSSHHLLSSQLLGALPMLGGIVSSAPRGFWWSLLKTLGGVTGTFVLLTLLAGPFSRSLQGRSRAKQIAWIVMGLLLVGASVKAISREPKAKLDSVAMTAQPPPSPKGVAKPNKRKERLRELRLINLRRQPEQSPDVLIVIIESFRHELVAPDVMPNLHAAATDGLWCRKHFSGGNATSHGVFSIVTGMNATWFDSSIRFSPPMYDLFRSAGYELGFFAGHDDWRQFYMDAFVREDHFDVFATTPQNGLKSDRQSVQSVIAFLDHDQPRAPRLAILYLYATHLPYRSYVEDQVFQPAAADDFQIPYLPTQRESVWKRYKNSARTVDRWLAPLIGDAKISDTRTHDAKRSDAMISSTNRVVLVTGDHGESFLEDGTVGHGTKISAVQNMTPAIICGPGVPRGFLQTASAHSDLLPTLVGALGLGVNGLNALDGIDLTKPENLRFRRHDAVTRDYLSDRYRPIDGVGW